MHPPPPPPKPPLPPPPPPPHVRPASRPAPTIAKHEAAFAKFEKKLEGAGDETLRLSDLPLPPKHGSVSGASRADPVDDRKKAVKKALLRWHPDKFDLSKFHPEDRDAVKDAVADVTRRIVKERKFLTTS